MNYDLQNTKSIVVTTISLLNKIEDDSLIKINKHPLYTFCVSTHPKIQDRILKINQFII
jgi:hypothetical protein